MRHQRLALVSALAGPLALASVSCATRGALHDLETRVATQEGRLDALEQRVGVAESSADQALRRAEAAESAARDSAQRADDAARRADAMFKKSVRK
jgi:hypothetical protein